MRLPILIVLTGILASTALAVEPSEGRVTLDVKDADISAVVRTLFDQTGKSYGISQDVKGTVTAHFEDVTLNQALRLVLLPNGLVWKVTDGAYMVSKKKELKEDIHGRIDPVPPENPRERKSTDLILEKIPLNFLDARELIGFIQGEPKMADALRQQGVAGMFALPGGRSQPSSFGFQPYGTQSGYYPGRTTGSLMPPGLDTVRYTSPIQPVP